MPYAGPMALCHMLPYAICLAYAICQCDKNVLEADVLLHFPFKVNKVCELIQYKVNGNRVARLLAAAHDDIY